MKHLFACALIAIIATLTSCESIDDERIPPVAVRLELDNQGLWDTYGVHGYGDYRYFIREEKKPSNFTYTDLTRTGFGGILLINGYYAGDYNVPLAYDLACPVEARYNVRLQIDRSTFEAHCKKCGSRFDVCEGYGRPTSGEALNRGFGMKQYSVFPAQTGGYVITR
jgi:hypothetical protein